MKFCFVWPFKSNIEGESLEFYNAIKKKDNIELVEHFNQADYIFYMMDIRNCINMTHYNKDDMKEDILEEIYSNKEYHKEVIIDYNDWTDTRNVPDEVLPFVKKYFKRSVVDKNTMTLVSYSREIIPISYAVRSDYIEYDSQMYSNQNDCGYLYDVCCLFNKGDFSLDSNRGLIPYIIEKYDGPKFVGTAVGSSDYGARYHTINDRYYDTLKRSKIIVTANPPNWEGDFRLWEALLCGNLVLCDKMLLPHMLKYPLLDKIHIVYYEHSDEILPLINYYITNENERNKIGVEGREYVLKYHTFSSRLDEILEQLV